MCRTYVYFRAVFRGFMRSIYKDYFDDILVYFGLYTRTFVKSNLGSDIQHYLVYFTLILSHL